MFAEYHFCNCISERWPDRLEARGGPTLFRWVECNRGKLQRKRGTGFETDAHEDRSAGRGCVGRLPFDAVRVEAQVSPNLNDQITFEK